MSAKEQIKQLVDYFKREPLIKDKTNSMGDGLLLGAQLADEANERSIDSKATVLAIQERYREQILAQDLNPNKDPELVDLRGGKATAGERMTAFEQSTTAQFQQTVFFANNIEEMKEGNYKNGGIVKTKGFYAPGDKGKGEYLISDVATQNIGTFSHMLKNGLYADLVVKNNKLHINQLGAREGYWGEDVDNFSIIQTAFDSNVGEIEFLGSGYFVRDVGKRLKTNRRLKIEGKYATLLSDNGLFLNTNVSSKKVTIHNFNIVSNNHDNPLVVKAGVGLETANIVDGVKIWGACVEYKNVKVEGFKTGVKSDGLFQSTMKDVVSHYNDISFLFKSTLTFSNVNTFDLLTSMYAEYGIVLEDFRNAKFTNTTVENVDYGIIVDDKSQLTEFKDNWFEFIHNAPVVFGKIDEMNLSLNKSSKTNEQVTFKDNRFSTVEYQESKPFSDLFFDKSTLFTSKYKEANKKNSDFDKLMSDGVQYANKNINEFKVTYQTGGVVSYPTENTPFGTRKIAKILGLDTTKNFFMHCDYPNWIEGHVYLLKYRVKASKPVRLQTLIPATPSATIDVSNSIMIGAEAWTTISSIVKMKSSFSGITLDNGGRFGFNLYDVLGNLDIEAIDPMIIDLTDIFGVGNEPDVNLNQDLAPYLTYISNKTTSRTGSSFTDISRKERITTPVGGGWTGNASYRYLGNGLTEITADGLGTGNMSSSGDLLFTLIPEYRPKNAVLGVALVANVAPYNQVLNIMIKPDGRVIALPIPNITVTPNNLTASVQFNILVSSSSL